MSNLTENYRLAAKDWVDKNAAADLLEQTKSTDFAERVQKLLRDGPIPMNRAEIQIKADPEWREYITKMVEARREANLAKVKLEFIRMKFQEAMSTEASTRAEMKLVK